ncbi:MAG: hypothetical protein NTW29_08040 [Bacteroidetes bacterium]|nr:hypothetical protein [Bacteroidota bacterium]
MKQLAILSIVLFLFACNNEKKPEQASAENNNNNAPVAPAPSTEEYKPTYNLTYTADGTEISNSASLLVTSDKDKLKPDAPFLCMLTSNAAKNNNEYLTLNFLMNTKPGTYPVVGASFQRGKDNASEMYGGILGGKPKLTDYTVTITECKDLGSNNMGGHKWSISGTWQGIVVKATSVMLMDKSKNHPAEVKLDKGSFTNLTFDDNWEQMMEEGLKKMKEKAK